MARRITTWEDTILARDITSGFQQVNSLILGMADGAKQQATVIRTIIEFSLYSTSVAGAWGVQRVDLAIGMSAQEAFAASVLPDPNTATEKPARGWLWRTSVSISQNGIGTDIVHRIRADIRGARKLENGELYVIAHSTARAGTTFTVRWDGLVRCLFKL